MWVLKQWRFNFFENIVHPGIGHFDGRPLLFRFKDDVVLAASDDGGSPLACADQVTLRFILLPSRRKVTSNLLSSAFLFVALLPDLMNLPGLFFDESLGGLMVVPLGRLLVVFLDFPFFSSLEGLVVVFPLGCPVDDVFFSSLGGLVVVVPPRVPGR